jgi:hypothetical protein
MQHLKMSITLSNLPNMMLGCGVEPRISKLLSRKQLIHENEVLTQSEVRKHLRSPLVDTFFRGLDEMAIELM